MLKIIGIDPGLRITGYSVVALSDGVLEPTLLEAGIIQLNGKLSIEDRLHQLHVDLSQIIEGQKPQQLAVEKLYAHYKHPRTAILMAHARGVILLCAKQHGMTIEHLPSTAVKKAITGYGHASKSQIQRSVQSQLQLSELPEPPDVADAIAIALCHARRIAIDRL